MCTLARSCGAASRVSIRLSDSGVVTSAVGQRRSCRARSALGVSPVRMPVVQCGASAASGRVMARKVSAASARMGVIHNTPSGGAPRVGLAATDAALPAAAGAARANAPSHTA